MLLRAFWVMFNLYDVGNTESCGSKKMLELFFLRESSGKWRLFINFCVWHFDKTSRFPEVENFSLVFFPYFLHENFLLFRLSNTCISVTMNLGRYVLSEYIGKNVGKAKLKFGFFKHFCPSLRINYNFFI